MTDRLELMGAPGSPYTRKMLALLRYRHIDYNIIWGGAMGAPEGYPKPKVALLPTFTSVIATAIWKLQWIARRS